MMIMVKVEAIDQIRRKIRLAVGAVRGNAILSGFFFSGKVKLLGGGNDNYNGCHGQDQSCM